MQVLDYYNAVVDGGSTIYYYKAPDNTSAATRIYKGTQISIAVKNGEAEVVVGAQGQAMAHIFRPKNGWINGWYIGPNSWTPVYRTETDRLNPPQVLLSRTAATLTVQGGADGDCNALCGYQVQYRERLREAGDWPDAWTDDGTLTASAADNVKTQAAAVCDGGWERQYRVRCVGTAEESYFSDWAVCATTMALEAADIGSVTVAAPAAQAFLHTGAGGLLLALHRAQSLRCSAVVLQYRYADADESPWTDAAQLPAEEGYGTHRLPVPGDGEHTLQLRLRAADGDAVGAVCTLPFTQQTREYSRRLAAGMVISGGDISHQAELRQLLMQVNALRQAHGLSEAVFADAVGRFAHWHNNLTQLRTLLLELQGRYPAADGCFAISLQDAQAVPAYPTAQTVEQVRSVLDEF